MTNYSRNGQEYNTSCIRTGIIHIGAPARSATGLPPFSNSDLEDGIDTGPLLLYNSRFFVIFSKAYPVNRGPASKEVRY
jgi:hypothetical protein